MEAKRFFRSTVTFLFFPGIPIFLVMLLLSILLSLGFVHDTDPDAYNEYIVEALGLTGGTWYSLPADVEELITSLGFDPSIIADEIMANKWINENGGEIDLGIQLSILEGESAGGTSMGSCSGIASAAKLSQNEVAAARWLLNYWKEHNVREWSEVASEMIRPDYSDYTAHCSAGEMGPNAILPTTGLKICRDGLSLHPSDTVKSCNFFDKRVAPYGKTWWLNAIGYRASQPKDRKFSNLWGWNHDVAFRNQLINRAEYFNLATSGLADISPTSEDTYLFQGNWWKKQIVSILKKVGLLDGTVYADSFDYPTWDQPQVVDGFTNPYPGSYLCGYSYGTPVANGVHWGVDLCFGSPWGSAPIYAMHDGTVTYSGFLHPSEWLAGQWWISGNVVAIEGKDSQGNTIWTAYGHGSNGTIRVSVGQEVRAGDMLMMSGTTGFSSGIHLHLAMQINGGWVNPYGYLGGD